MDTDSPKTKKTVIGILSVLVKNVLLCRYSDAKSEHGSEFATWPIPDWLHGQSGIILV